MFALGVLLGIYSYGIFSLGILNLLSWSNILGFTNSWLLIIYVYLLHQNPIVYLKKIIIKLLRLDILSKALLCLLFLQLLVNLIGALGPEIGFDALWYHLSFPKIWLQRQSITFLPGPVFKYSVMPKLTETLYAAALSLSGVTAAKLIHYLFGLFSLIVTFQLSRKFLSISQSLLACVLLSSNLVFCWESISAYVDLTRTFFEILALKLFIDRKYTFSAISQGLAATVKIISLSSLLIYIFLFLISSQEAKQKLLNISKYIFFTLLIPLPWLLFSFLQTGNFFYPIFSPLLNEPFSLQIKDLFSLFVTSSDPISPVYIITAPLILFTKITKESGGLREIFTYAGISILIWFILPHPGFSRFYLPYLPTLSIVVVYTILHSKDRLIRKVLLSLIIIYSLFSISYRLIANSKFIPVITGNLTQTQFLSKNLNFSFGDYIDIDGQLQKLIPENKKLLVAGINNLFYLPSNLDFTHISEITSPNIINETSYQKIKNLNNQVLNYDYLLLRNPDANYYPDRNWTLLYQNQITHTQIYQKN